MRIASRSRSSERRALALLLAAALWGCTSTDPDAGLVIDLEACEAEAFRAATSLGVVLTAAPGGQSQEERYPFEGGDITSVELAARIPPGVGPITAITIVAYADGDRRVGSGTSTTEVSLAAGVVRQTTVFLDQPCTRRDGGGPDADDGPPDLPIDRPIVDVPGDGEPPPIDLTPVDVRPDGGSCPWPTPPFVPALKCETVSPFGAPQKLLVGEALADDEEPALSGDGLLLLYSSRASTDAQAPYRLRAFTRATRFDPFVERPETLGPNMGNGLRAPSLTADGLTLYFDAPTGPSGTRALFRTRRSDPAGSFGPGERVEELYLEGVARFSPGISPDGATLFFAQNEQATSLYRAELEGCRFGEPSNLSLAGQGVSARGNSLDIVYASTGGTFFTAPYSGLPSGPFTELTTTASDQGPFITHDDCSVFFASTRESQGGDRDLFVASRPCTHDAPILAVVAAGSTTDVNDSNSSNHRPFLAADGSLYFSSTRGDRTTYTLYRATAAADGSFSGTAPVGVSGNASVDGTDLLSPSLTADLRRIYFCAAGASQVFTAERAELTAPFSPPVAVSNAPFCDPAVSGNGDELFVHDAVQGALRRGTLSDPSSSTMQMPVAEISDVNSAETELSPSLSADGLSLYFVRRDAAGPTLWVAHRPSTAMAFSTVTPLPFGEVTTLYQPASVSASPDQCTLAFSQEVTPGSGTYALFLARRR